jgi:cytochrome P450
MSSADSRRCPFAVLWSERQSAPVRADAGPPVSLLELPSYLQAVQAFAGPLGRPADFQPEIAALVRRIEVWDRRGKRALARLQSPPIFRQVFDFGSLVFDTHRLWRAVHTRRIDDWLNAPATSPDIAVAFASWRRALVERYDAVRALSADILLASNLEMFERNPLQLFVGNIRKLAQVFAGPNYRWGSAGVTLGTSLLALCEWRFLGRLVGSALAARGLALPGSHPARWASRINAFAGEVLITPRHARQVREAYRMLRRHDVTGRRADEIVLAALRQADRAAGKPWKGLVKLQQLVEYAGLDPRAGDFLDTLHAQTSAPVQYTYTPGLEWVVRDYELGKKLLQMDGRVADGSDVAALQQGRVSVMPGIAKATPGATEFARKYFGPVENFLDSMVTADGADHQRLRKPFLRFFSRRAVFTQAELVEATVTELLDHAAQVARTGGGAFDFKHDFAFRFPIRVICGMLGIRGADVESIQRWTEESTRAMDTEAGVSLATARRGQASIDQQRAFFGRLLAEARAGRPASELIRALACDETLSEAERISNLSVIVFAGFETTTGLLCKGVSELLRHRRQWDSLRSSLVEGPEIAVEGERVADVDLRWYRWALTEPREADAARRERLADLLACSEPLRRRLATIDRQESHLERAVEEMLRWCAPGSIIPLTASQDLDVPVPRAMTIRGRELQAGDKLRFAKGETVIVAVDEINRRCPMGRGQFDPQGEGTFDITREGNTQHLSFGVKHMCIGATLARENAKRALEGVLRRFPDLELAGTPIPQDMELFHGLASLPVRSRILT